MAAHQSSPSLGFSRQEHWSGLPFHSLMHESESEVTQSCLTLCDPMDCSPPGSSVHGIFQARVLEWGAIAFSTPPLGLYIWISLPSLWMAAVLPLLLLCHPWNFLFSFQVFNVELKIIYINIFSVKITNMVLSSSDWEWGLDRRMKSPKI